MRFQWSDLQYFLAVARTGSTSEAARALGLNQTTCACRISALETALGMTLFDRGPTGYKLTPFGSSLVTQAQVIESAAHAIGEQAAEMAVSQRFLIRFTTSDWIADQIAQTAVAQFAQLRFFKKKLLINLSPRVLTYLRLKQIFCKLCLKQSRSFTGLQKINSRFLTKSNILPIFYIVGCHLKFKLKWIVNPC